MSSKELISIVTPCYNEEDNIEELCMRVSLVMAKLPYEYEHICIDNHSSDATVKKIKQIAKNDKRLKLIVNARNFGHIRSPFYGLLQSSGDATILIASDLQDPPEIIPDFIKKWELGFKTVLAVKPESYESSIKFKIRKIYYRLISKISEVPLIQNATGAGLFDKAVINILKDIQDPYPYFRGLLCEIGFPIATVPFKQPLRTRGVTKNNFYTLYDIAVLGVISHSKVPIRIATFSGIFLGFLSLIIAIVYLTFKICFWDKYPLGFAPIVIGLFFLLGIQLMFIGILGEYISSIHNYVQNRPIVVEKERINFD